MRSHPNLSPAVATIGMCLPMVLGLAACSSEPQVGGPEVAKNLLAHDSAVNVIYVPSVGSRELNSTESYMFTQEEVKSFEQQLADADESAVEPIIGAFSKATYGRYIPRTVTITKAPDFKLKDACVPVGDVDFYDELEQNIQPYLKPEAVNVVALGAFTCQMLEASDKPYASTSAPAGVTPINKHPVLTRGFFGEVFSTAVVHEAGHFFGLPHAGKAACADETILEKCTVDVSGDQNSVMSYAQYSPMAAVNFGRYTAPELNALGLLEPDEVIGSTQPQTVQLQSMTAAKGVKLVIGGTEEEPVYMSWENSVFTSYDPKCSDDTSLETTTESEPESCMRQKANEGASLQVRFPLRTSDAFIQGTTDTDSFVMVDTDPQSMQTRSRGETREVFADGYTKTPAVVYENDTLSYTLDAVSATDGARLTISVR